MTLNAGGTLQKATEGISRHRGSCDPARLSGIPEGGRSFVVSSLLDLRLLELTLYFQQDTQRIARC